MEKTYAHQSIGVELLPDAIRAVAIEWKDNEVVVDACFEFPLKTGLPDEENVKPLYIENKDPKFQYWLENDLVVSILKGEAVLVRPMEIKLTRLKEIDQVLYFQAEPLVPFSIEETVVDRIVMGANKEGTALTLLAAKGEQIQAHLEDLTQLEIDPEIVTSEQVALSAYLQAILLHPENSEHEAQILIALDTDHTTCILNKKGKLAAAQTIPVGCKSLKTEVYTEEEGHKQELKTTFDTLRHEISRVAYALGKQLKGEQLGGIVLCGDGAGWGHLGKELLAGLQKPLLPVKVFKGMTLEQQNIYATALGAALTGLSNYRDQINFRQKEYRFKNPLKRFKKGLFAYGAIAIGLACSAYFAGQQYLGYQKDEVRQHYVELLADIKRPFNEVEAQYLKKSSSDSSLTGNVKKLSIKELSARLEFLEKEIQTAPMLFPLYPNIPRVSDVIAWLTNHPQVVLKSVGKGGGSGLLQLEGLNYVMTKRPDMTKKNERYQVKVELDLSASSPKAAREFHDALISPNEMVDPKAEVKWNATKGRYRTSFYLKDRTIYPLSGH